MTPGDRLVTYRNPSETLVFLGRTVLEWFLLGRVTAMHLGLFSRVCLLSSVCSVSRAALAEENAEPFPSPVPDVRFELGARTAYSVPVGHAVGGGGDIDDLVTGQVPIWVDLGARFSGDLFAGVTGSYGFGVVSDMLKSQCVSDPANGVLDLHCTAHDIHLGLELIYYPRVRSRFAPWLGGGVGWEWLNVGIAATVQGEDSTVSIDFNGPELLMLEGGVDYVVTPGFGLGLFVAFSADMYLSASTNCTGSCTGYLSGPVTIDSRTTHEWLFGGARATFLP